MQTQTKFITTKRAAGLLGITVRTVIQWIESGKLAGTIVPREGEKQTFLYLTTIEAVKECLLGQYPREMFDLLCEEECE